MKTETTNKRKPLRAFQAWPENEKRLSIASRMGINVSELINESLAASLEKQLEDRFQKLQTEIKMVRDTGFEPVTPTVSR